MLVALVLAGCAAREPVLPIGARGPFRPEADEVTLWRQAEQEEGRIPRALPRYEDAALEAYLAGVAAGLVAPGAAAAGAPPIRVLVLRDPGLVAFAMPNGHVYVSTGLLARLESEGQVAAVLAHEVAHVTHRDALRVARSAWRWPGTAPGAGPAGGGLVGVAATDAAPPPTNPFRALGLRLATLAAVDGHGRRREREADREALDRLAAAGRDPGEARRAYEVLKREAPAEEGREPFYLGQPARLDERIASLTAGLGELASSARPFGGVAAGGTTAGPGATPGGAPGSVSPAPTAPDPYEERVRPALRDNALMEARADRFAAARAQLARVLRSAPDDAVARLYAGDVDRLEAQRVAGGAERERLLAEARRAYERAAALDPKYAEPWRQLGLLHYQQHEPALARQAFGRYLALAPDAADARRVREYIAELDR